MKNKKIKKNMEIIRKSVNRFPLTIILSIILTLSMMYLEREKLNVFPLKDSFVKWNILIFYSLLGSLIIKLSNEKGSTFKSKGRKLIPYGIGIGLVLLYRFFYLKEFTYSVVTRNVGITVLLSLSIFLIQGFSKKDKYEFYFWDILKSALIALSYSSILFLGIVFLIALLKKLFGLNIENSIYTYVLLLSYIFINTYVFVSKLPLVDEKYNKRDYNKVLIALMKFILIPLSYIYTVILYMYFLKLSTEFIIPKGVIAHLIVWYSLVSILVIFITRNYTDNKSILKFNRILPKFNLPLLFILFVSIYLRVNEYGFTENRYYLLLLSIWIVFSMCYYSFKNNRDNIIILIVLAMIIFVSQIGPISAHNMARISQEKRLKEELIEANILQGNNIIKNSYASEKNQKEISNILYYFDTKHSLEDIGILPDGFSLNNMYFYFGFKYDPDIRYRTWKNDRHYFNAYREKSFVDIKGYESYLELKSTDSKVKIENVNLNLDLENLKLIFEYEDGIREEVLLKKDISQIYGEMESGKNMFLNKSSKKRVKDFDIKIIYKDVNGWTDDEEFYLNYLDIIILLNRM